MVGRDGEAFERALRHCQAQLCCRGHASAVPPLTLHGAWAQLCAEKPGMVGMIEVPPHGPPQNVLQRVMAALSAVHSLATNVAG